MKVIVTGGAGFIGSHIAERLVKDGHNVWIVDSLISGYKKNIPPGTTFIEDDIRFVDPYIFNDVDAVFHNAASKKNICLQEPHKDLRINGGGTLRLLRICEKKGVKHFIHASTGSVYGEVDGVITETSSLNPVSFYGVSKLAGEKYVSLFSSKMKTCILRYFHVYGDRQEDDSDLGGVVAIFKRRAREGEPLVVHGSGNQKRVFTHVNDVVEANIKAWKFKNSGEVYNCASDKQVSIIDLAKSISKNKTWIKYDSPLEGDIFNFNIDNSKIRNDLKITFKPFEL
jgi:nucleoside-diphosphate-sugar epimerase